MSQNREYLLNTMKSTAGSRFIAAARLEARDRRLTRVTAFTSAYVILLTIFPYFIKLPTNVTDLFNLITVGLSVVILVSSLLQYSSGDIVNAEQHHRSGLEINEQRRLLQLLPEEVPDADLKPFAERYNGILQKYSVNHSDIDYLKYQTERPHDFPWMTSSRRRWIVAKVLFVNHVANIVLFAITVIMVWLVAFYAYPKRIIAQNSNAHAVGERQLREVLAGMIVECGIAPVVALQCVDFHVAGLLHHLELIDAGVDLCTGNYRSGLAKRIRITAGWIDDGSDQRNSRCGDRRADTLVAKTAAL
jgi:hypothetical protein